MARWFPLVLCLVLSHSAFSAEPLAIVDPETETRAAIKFLESIGDERFQVRFLSTYSIPQEERAEFEVLFRFAFRQLTLSPNRRVFPTRVPGSNTLWWIDLTSWGWNDVSWRQVAIRDIKFREPWVQPATAQKLRALLGERQPGNFQAIGIVDAWGFYNRAYHTINSPDYYDLIFAEQRYPILKDNQGNIQVEFRNVLRQWPGGVWTDGKFYPGGWYPYKQAFAQRGFKDFPQNKQEWFTAFIGGLKGEDYEKALVALQARRGAVLRGATDVEVGGSFVARNNRQVWLAPALSRFGAIYGETFDVKKTAGKRDLEENAFTDQPRDKGRATVDGGELLFTLPAGDGLATLVINAQGKRVEEVPPDIAIHTRDARDRRVRNGPLACYACHAEWYGWIPLNNVLEQAIPNEIDVRFKDLKTGLPDKKAAEDYDSFFLGWGDEIKPIRETTKGIWLEATGTKAKNYADGWTGLQLAQLTLKWHHRYLDPITLEQACRETGAPEAFLRVAAVRSTLRRSAELARKEPIPRSTWDEDVFPELMKLLSSSRERVYP